MKSIFIIIPNYKIGGAEKIMIMTANLLTKYYKVYLIIISNQYKKNLNLNDKVQLINFNKKKIIYSIKSIKNYIKFYNPDYIISTLTHLNILLIIIKLIFKLKNKLIIREANTTSLNLSIKNIFVKKIYKILITKTYPLSDKIVCVSEGVKKDLINNFNIQSDLIEVIYNFINIERIKLLSTSKMYNDKISIFKPYILSLGSLTEQKNHEFLIKTFSKITDQNINLLIIGNGNFKKRLKRLSKSLNLENRIIFLEEVENPHPYILNSLFLILCSKWEGLPNVLLEALALNKYVVSSNCQSGPSEIIENINYGELFENDDSIKLLSIINKLTNKENIDTSNFIPDKFLIENYEKKYLNILNQLTI